MDFRTNPRIVLPPIPTLSQEGQGDFRTNQQIILPPIYKRPPRARMDFKFNQQTFLPPLYKGPQKMPPFSPSQYTVLPSAQTQQEKPQEPAFQESAQKGTAAIKKASQKKKQKEKEKPIADRPALTPETVLKESLPCLSAYELEEIKEYKQVWYLGQKHCKAQYSTEKTFNSGFDTVNGFYKAIINDHLAYRFEILKEMGSGFTGKVLKCRDHKTMEIVAIKVIRNNYRGRQLGMAEVKLLQDLRRLDKNNSANIVHMKEHFYFRNHLCIVVEFFPKDLMKALEETKEGFSEKEVKKYAVDVLKCLKILKQNGIVHGDLKPENVLLYNKNSGKNAAVTDFGGSYFVKEKDQPGAFTLQYTSPEMLLGKPCNTATDMWSLGCILAELYLCHCLFQGHDVVDHFKSIMKVLGVPPRELVVPSPNREKYFDCNGIPWKIKDITQKSSTLASKLKTKNAHFLDFIECCLEYDPTKRITPELALQHPWIKSPLKKL